MICSCVQICCFYDLQDMEAAGCRTAVSGVKCHMTPFMIIHYLNYYKTFLLQKWRRDDRFWVHSSFYCPLDICLNQLNIRSGGKCGFLLWPKKAFTLYSRSQDIKHQSRLDRLDLRSSSQPLWKAQLLLTRCCPHEFSFYFIVRSSLEASQLLKLGHSKVSQKELKLTPPAPEHCYVTII